MNLFYLEIIENKYLFCHLNGIILQLQLIIIRNILSLVLTISVANCENW